MKKIAPVSLSFASVRLLLIVIIAALVAGSFAATALMQSKKQQAKATSAQSKNDPTADFWQETFEKPVTTQAAPHTPLQLKRFRSFTLNREAIERALAAAPMEFTAAAGAGTFILSLPSPAGGFQRFSVNESPVMEPGLAKKHPDIKTYSGRGIEDPAATIRFDLTPLGFHASVRGPSASWYIDPYYHLEQSVYASYFRRDLDNPHGVFIESEVDEASISANHAFYRANHDVELNGSGFASQSALTITISDRETKSFTRQLTVKSDENGSFDLKFLASLNGVPGTFDIAVTDGTRQASTTYDIFSQPSPTSLAATGDQLRTYRLALLTDPGYATYFGGPANVTAAKVTLINRVTQVYEYDLSMRLVLIANNDLLNLDTAAQMTTANGPCGGAACYSASQATTCGSSTLTRNRQVIGLLVGASAFDIGHIALGASGGGIASLGVVGGNNKAQGCTGVTTPTGDLFAVDYVAHEMGHQFSGNHTFNGTTSNCSTTNRNAGTSVEPGSGTSVMAYAGICGADNTQPHSDPYFSERSFDEMTTYTSAAETNLNEVQMGVLTSFNTDGQSFQLRYNGNDSAAIIRGTNYTTGGVKAAIEAISGWPAGATVTVSALSDTAFTVTFGGSAANTDVLQLSLVNFTSGCTGYANEIAKGAQTTRRGTVTATGNTIPTVTAPVSFTIPLRTPFALTASGFDADSDTLTYMWEQNDRGATGTSNGTALQSNTKLNGPLFRQFGVAANVSASDTLLYNSPGENPVTTNPTRVFPDMNQILANQTNAQTGTCTAGDIICFSEYLPTALYVGVAGVNPFQLHFRVTVRDGRGGVNSNGPADTTLTLATTAGPFLVTSQNTAVTYSGGSTQTVAWDVASTDIAPVSTATVKISLSTDGGTTFPYVLIASTPNDGTELVTLPNVSTTTARLKVEAVGNIFFDVNRSNFTIQSPTAAPVSISGSISALDGTPMAGATVNLNGARAAQTITDSSGNYSFANIDANDFYTVTPALANYSFSPASRSFTLVANKTDAVFTALPNSVASTNAIDTNAYFVRQQYLDFLGREPDQSGFEYWTSKLNQCGGDAGCLLQQRIDVSAAFFGSQEFRETGSYVYRLYEGALGRQLSYSEFAADRQQVIGGANLEAAKAAFANVFVGRAEFTQKYQTHTTAATFVDKVLQTLRDSAGADLSSERTNLISRYSAGGSLNESRALVLRDIAEQTAFVNAVHNRSFVLMEYFGYLRRGTDQGGYDFWLDVLNNRAPQNYRGMVCSFLTSTEYQSRFSPVITHNNTECGR